MPSLLATQLANLQQQAHKGIVPAQQSTKWRASFLFEAAQAADMDLDTLYSIGCSGLAELAELESELREFEQTLFGEDVPGGPAREQLSDSDAAAVDRAIAHFAKALAPFFLEPAAGKCLEWLIRRFKAHEYNAAALVEAFLPFHETAPFVRLVSLTRFGAQHRLAFLNVMRQTQAPLDRATLVQRCVTDGRILQLVLEGFPTEEGRANATYAPFAAAVLLEYVAVAARDTAGLSEARLHRLLAWMVGGALKFPSTQACAFLVLSRVSMHATLRADVAQTLLAAALKHAKLQRRPQALLLCVHLFQTQPAHLGLSQRIVHVLAKWDADFPAMLAEARSRYDCSVFEQSLRACLLLPWAREDARFQAMLAHLGAEAVERSDMAVDEAVDDAGIVEDRAGSSVPLDGQGVPESVNAAEQAPEEVQVDAAAAQVAAVGEDAANGQEFAKRMGTFAKQTQSEGFKSVARVLELPVKSAPARAVAIAALAVARFLSQLDEAQSGEAAALVERVCASPAVRKAGGSAPATVPSDWSSACETVFAHLAANEDSAAVQAAVTAVAACALQRGSRALGNAETAEAVFMLVLKQKLGHGLLEKLVLEHVGERMPLLAVRALLAPSSETGSAARVWALTLLASVLKPLQARAGAPDMQAVLPALLIAVSDRDRSVRTAALECLSALEGLSSGGARRGAGARRSPLDELSATPPQLSRTQAAAIAAQITSRRSELMLDDGLAGRVVRDELVRHSSGLVGLIMAQACAPGARAHTRRVLLDLARGGRHADRALQSLGLYEQLSNDAAALGALEELLLEAFGVPVDGHVAVARDGALFSRFLALLRGDGGARAAAQTQLADMVTSTWAGVLGEAAEADLAEALATVAALGRSAQAVRAAQSALRRVSWRGRSLVRVFERLVAGLEATATGAEAARVVCQLCSVLETIVATASILRGPGTLVRPLFGVLRALEGASTISTVAESGRAAAPASECAYAQQLALAALEALLVKRDTAVDAADLDMDAVVAAVRSTDNPQTHAEASRVMVAAAQRFPALLLASLVPLVTLMSTSLVRSDDAFALDLIQRKLEAVLPAAAGCLGASGTVTVLTPFVRALAHAPGHRRQRLLGVLVATLGASAALAPCACLLLQAGLPDVAQRLVAGQDAGVQLRALARVLEHLRDVSFVETVEVSEAPLPEDPLLREVARFSAAQRWTYRAACCRLVGRALADRAVLEAAADDSEVLEMAGNVAEAALGELVAQTRALGTGGPEARAAQRPSLRAAGDALLKAQHLLPLGLFVDLVRRLLDAAQPLPVRRKALGMVSERLGQLRGGARALQTACGTAGTAGAALLDVLETVLDSRAEETAAELALRLQALLCVNALAAPLDRQTAVLRRALALVCGPAGAKHADKDVVASALVALAAVLQALGRAGLPDMPVVLPLLFGELDAIEAGQTGRHATVLRAGVLTALDVMVRALEPFMGAHLPTVLEHVLSAGVWQVSGAEDGRGDAAPLMRQTQDRARSIVTTLATEHDARALLGASLALLPAIVKGGSAAAATIYFEGLVAGALRRLTPAQVDEHHVPLVQFALVALDLRRTLPDRAPEHIAQIEALAAQTLGEVALQLSETRFRAVVLKLVEWAASPAMAEAGFPPKERDARLRALIAAADHLLARLGSLFVPFMAYFVDPLLAGWTRVEPQDELWGAVADLISRWLAVDAGAVVDAARVDQLAPAAAAEVARSAASPDARAAAVACIVQLAGAAGDEALWRVLVSSIAPLARSDDAPVRSAALDILEGWFAAYGEHFVAVLPDVAPILSELLEDGDRAVEIQAQRVSSAIQGYLGPDADLSEFLG